MRYVKGTFNFDILYNRSKNPYLVRFIDLDWVGCVDDRKSTFGYVFSLGMSVITWANKKQPVVALSLTDSKHWGTIKPTCEVVWLWRMLLDHANVSSRASTLFFVTTKGW